MLDGETADLYEIRTDRIANKPTRESSYQVHYVEIAKYWFGNDRRLLKKVVETEVVNDKALSRETTLYDYKAGVKIEAPIE